MHLSYTACSRRMQRQALWSGEKGDKKRRSRKWLLLLLFLSLMFRNVPRFTKHEKGTGDLESSDCIGIITNGKPTRCMKTVFQKAPPNKEEREGTKELLILKIRLCFLYSWAAMSRAFSFFFLFAVLESIIAVEIGGKDPQPGDTSILTTLIDARTQTPTNQTG